MSTALLTGRTIIQDQKEWLYFAGTSYLGMSHDESFKSLVIEGLNLFGLNYGGSRHSNIQLNVFEQAETFLTNWIGSPDSLITSSGTLSGQLCLQFIQEKFKLIYAPQTHSALFNKPKSYFAEWPYKMIEEVRKHPQLPIAILSNSIDPLTAKYLDFSWIKELADRENIMLIIDDSHGIGVTGSQGNGCYETLNNMTDIPIIVLGSLGKALSVPGGFIAGPKNLIRSLYNHPLFIGSSPPSPAFLYAMINAKEIYQAKLSQLKKNIQLFVNQSDRISNFNYLKEYPVFHTSDNSLYEYLKQHSIICSSFQYPTRDSPSLTRIVINATHQFEDLVKLSSVVNRFFV